MQAYINAMLQEAEKMLAHSYAPYSRFPVAACIITPDKQFFTGCNIENASYSLSMCAEASAIAAMVSAGQRRIKEIVVLAKNVSICPPCGACRQRISEFAAPTTLIHLAGDGIIQKTLTLGELLPHGFSLERENLT
jgi:cytidine deaminase